MSESTAVRKKADFSSLKTAARSLGNRNVILLIIFYSCMNYSCYYKNGFRGLLVMDDHGISATVYGTMISVFLICGLIIRTPGGAIIDRFRGNIKPIFIISSILKGGCALAYLYANSTATMYLAFILDGFLWSFVGVFPYALLATFVDRRIVGTAFALCEGISFIVGSSARGLGAKMFTELGATIPTYISFGIQLVGVAAIFFFDNEKLKESAGLSLGAVGGSALLGSLPADAAGVFSYVPVSIYASLLAGLILKKPGLAIAGVFGALLLLRLGVIVIPEYLLLISNVLLCAIAGVWFYRKRKKKEITEDK